jgi:aminobenzoyl-glutamate utilization protein B
MTMDVVSWIEEHKTFFTGVSDQIWAFAETGYKEVNSSKLLADKLEEAGFTVERGIAEIPTAFVGSYGKGKPVVALLGEYDALPNLSQQAATQQKPLVEGGSGHGCGHNLLGTGSLAAVLALKEAIAAGDVQGTVRYYGCPAEENGSGKAFMARAGVFNDVDITLTWHPSMFNGSFSLNLLANLKVTFKFYGRAAHAAGDPYNGRSALDALELMNVGVNYLREHIIPDARIHYVTVNGGGPAPNVVPAYAESLYLLRAPRPDQLKEVYERVLDVARGAALMTGTKVEFSALAGASNLLLNDTIDNLMLEKMASLTPPAFTEAEKCFAQEIAETFPKGANSAAEISKLLGPGAVRMLATMKQGALFEGTLPAFNKDVPMPGSSDVGNVSWVTPTGQIMTTCNALGTPGHSWQAAAQNGTSIGHKGMLYAGKVLALSALAFFQDPQLVAKAQAEFNEKRSAAPLIHLVPDDVKPPLQMNPK